VRVVEGASAARATVLARRPASLPAVPPAVRDKLESVFGPDVDAQGAVKRILADVRAEGDGAVARYNQALDGVEVNQLEIASAAIEQAYEKLAPDLRAALEFAASRIREYHQEQRQHAAQSFFNAGRGQLVRAIERVGIYVPGTAAVYPSSVLMTAIPARVAGVAEVLMATPAGGDGEVSHLKLAAARIAGVDRVFCAGGAQAIGAFAFGTETIPRVDKIFGPGGLFVTLAKQLVYGEVGVDSIYGPSETIVVADDSAEPRLAAADLLAQAEHDELANPILLATSRRVADNVIAEVERQLASLPRAEIARSALQRQGGVAVIVSVEEAIVLANEYAPEHLCLNVRNARNYVELVKNAGAVFLGEDTPEAIGDYTAGPSHVMPTGGAARFSGALGVHDFLKVTSVVDLEPEKVMELAARGAVIARAEGFEGHALAMDQRSARTVLQR
jgi:histidinol dehydrogenase